MSDVSEKELSDIELCYKAMGLSFSDNPEQVERTYRKLKDEYGKAMTTSDSSERGTASENLRQLEELFATITGSLIYKDYAREYEKYKELKAEKQVERRLKQHEKTLVKEAIVNCPYCHKLIVSKLKVCIYCQGKILTPTEQLMAKAFKTRNVIVTVTILALVGLGALVLLNPNIFK